jgi:ribosomal protein L29
MATATSTISDLLSMSVEDLESDLRAQRLAVAKLRIDVELRKEKDTARYRRERRRLALLETALSRKRSESLQSAKNSSTVPARSAR